MRYVIPLGALILIAAGVWFHQAPGESQIPHPQLRKPAEGLDRQPVPAAEAKALPRAAAPRTESTPPRNPEEAVLVKPEPASVEWRKLSGSLERSLELSSTQQPEVERILRQRQDAIKICHDDIRKSGILDIRAYEWKVRGWKEDWYRSIDALLDRSQHQRFVALVEGGLFNEGLAFTVEPGITVLE